MPQRDVIFHQDSAPAHWARETVELLKAETTEFITSALWLPNGLDSSGLHSVVSDARKGLSTSNQKLASCVSALCQQRTKLTGSGDCRTRLHACINTKKGLL